jgi:ATP synthase protein I
MLPNPPNPNKKASGLQNFGHYSGMAFQMIAIILLFVWGGTKIDQKYFQGKDVFVIILSLVGVFIALYVVLKDLLNQSKKK